MSGKKESFPSIKFGEKCEKCPSFDNCQAILAARAIAEMATTVQKDGPLAPWHKRSLQEFAKPSDEFDGRSAIDTVNEAIKDCEGVEKVVTPEHWMPVFYPSGTFTFPGQVYRRRPIGSEVGADKTVVIEPKEDGWLYDIDPEETAQSVFTESGDYERYWPEVCYYINPMNSLVGNAAGLQGTEKAQAEAILKIVDTVRPKVKANSDERSSVRYRDERYRSY